MSQSKQTSPAIKKRIKNFENYLKRLSDEQRENLKYLEMDYTDTLENGVVSVESVIYKIIKKLKEIEKMVNKKLSNQEKQ